MNKYAPSGMTFCADAMNTKLSQLRELEKLLIESKARAEILESIIVEMSMGIALGGSPEQLLEIARKRLI